MVRLLNRLKELAEELDYILTMSFSAGFQTEYCGLRSQIYVSSSESKVARSYRSLTAALCCAKPRGRFTN